MVLAAFGTDVEEADLEARVHLEEEGTPIEEVERLARHYGLSASIPSATIEDLHSLLAAGRLPIVYLNRAVFGLRTLQQEHLAIRSYIVHSVIPVRITNSFVTFHDPLPPAAVRRKSIARFAHAHRHLGSVCVVCSRREGV